MRLGVVLTTRRKAENVSCKALTVQTGSFEFMCKLFAMVGRAAKTAERLKMSRNCAKQNTPKREYLRSLEYIFKDDSVFGI